MLMLRRPKSAADWFAYSYLVFALLVFASLVTVLLISPW